MTLGNAFTLGAASNVNVAGIATLNTTLRVGVWSKSDVAITLSGEVNVQENTTIGFQNNSTLNLTGTLTGSGDITVSRYDGTSSMTIAADTASYTGVIHTGTSGVSIKLGKDTVQIGGITGASSLTLADGTTASTLTLNVAAGKELTYTGSIASGISVVKSGDGKQILSGQILANDLTVSAGTLVLNNITTNGEMEISGDGTLQINNTIANNGSLTISADNIKLADDLSHYTVKNSDSESYSIDTDKRNGFKVLHGASFYLAEGTGITSTTLTASNSSGRFELNSDGTGIWFTSSGAVTYADFYISEGEVTVDGSVQARAQSYILNGGTMHVTEGLISTSTLTINTIGGGIKLADSATLTGLKTGDANYSTLIGGITGTGIIEVESGDWGTLINTANGFTGTTYVKRGKFTYQSNGLGSVLKLAAGVHMQITEHSTLSDKLVLETGNHEVHVNGSNTLTITGTVEGTGTFQKKGGSSIVYIKENASVANYDNNVGTTYIQGNATVTNLLTSGGTVNIEGGSVTTLRTGSGTSNISGGALGNLIATGGTTNITGTTVTVGEAGTLFNTTHATGIYGYNSTINIGNGTDAAVVTTTRVEMGDSNTGGHTGGTLNIKANATLVVTGTDALGDYHKTGFILSEWNKQSTLNVYGTILSKDASITYGDVAATIAIDGGTVVTKGLLNNKDNDGSMSVTLSNGGKLILGSTGITAKNATVSLGNGTVGITENTTISKDIELNGSEGTIFDTAKYNWSEKADSVTQSTEGGTLTVSGAVSGSGKLIKKGAGKLDVTGSTANYNGSVSVEGGELALTGTESLNVSELEVLAGSVLTVGANGNGTISVGSAAVTVEETATRYAAVFEGGATIKGNLDLTTTTSLTLNALDRAVSIEGGLTLSTGTMSLSGDVLTSLSALTEGRKLNLFTISGDFTLNGEVITALIEEDAKLLSTVFNNSDLSNYYLGYENNTVYAGLVTPDAPVIDPTIPEPTTATLSLLALAALAARRRRK